MAEPDIKAIGPDPVKWVERLLDVNAASQFTDREKELINRTFTLVVVGLQAIKRNEESK